MKPFKPSENVSYDASAASAAFHPNTQIVRIVCTTAANIVFGDNPTATVAAGIYMPADIPQYFRVQGGWKVAAIKTTAGTAGVMNVTELTN
jgi:hypothetical protein